MFEPYCLGTLPSKTLWSWLRSRAMVFVPLRKTRATTSIELAPRSSTFDNVNYSCSGKNETAGAVSIIYSRFSHGLQFGVSPTATSSSNGADTLLKQCASVFDDVTDHDNRSHAHDVQVIRIWNISLGPYSSHWDAEPHRSLVPTVSIYIHMRESRKVKVACLNCFIVTMYKQLLIIDNDLKALQLCVRTTGGRLKFWE